MERLFGVWSHLWPITSMVRQTCSLPIYSVLWITVPSLELIIMKRSFIAFPQPSRGWHLWESGSIALKDEFSFFLSLWRGLLLCVVTDPPALGGLRALLTTLSPVLKRWSHSSASAAIISKAQKIKSALKSLSQFPAKCLRTLSVDCNTTCLSWLVFSSPALSDLCFFFLHPSFHILALPAPDKHTLIY